jgi:hypothetical protein
VIEFETSNRLIDLLTLTVDFLIIFDYFLLNFFKKIIIYFTMIYFINKKI